MLGPKLLRIGASTDGHRDSIDRIMGGGKGLPTVDLVFH